MALMVVHRITAAKLSDSSIQGYTDQRATLCYYSYKYFTLVTLLSTHLQAPVPEASLLLFPIFKIFCDLISTYSSGFP